KAAADPTSPSYQPAIGQFRDGAKIKADMPSFFAVGAQYSPIERLRINAGYHVYGDKNASQYGNKQDLIDDNTWEITSGVEFDIIERLTASVGFQTTQYGFSDANMNDLSFSTSSNSYGCGFRVGLTKHATLDVSYMKTVYKDRTVATQTEAGQKLDTYSRDNRVFGVGVNLTF
ncbi:MAG: outer membrane beta-barrel protein, partial [Bacteroidales bacterium]|nr:outer membrane beta-barrel protein [Bacteroidales bacterium]